MQANQATVQPCQSFEGNAFLQLWNYRLHVGVPEIDRDHKILVTIASRLFHSRSQYLSNLVISNILSDIADYAQEHFSHEEFLMMQTRYPKCAEHVVEHWAFIHEMSRLVDIFERTPSEILPKLKKYLIEWLVHHGTIDDIEFGQFWKDQHTC